MATSISDLTNSTNLDGLLKKVYLPTMQYVAYDDTRFSDMIQTRTDLIPGGGNHIVHTAHTQRAEGVGTISEGGNWVSNVPVKGKQMTENVKYLNAYVALTGPVIKAANSGEKSAVNVVTDTFRSNIRAFKNNFDRMLMGDASAYCGRVSSIASDAVTLTNTSFPQAPYMADMFMPIGARMEAATFDASGIDSEGHINSGSSLTTFIVAGLTSRNLSAGTAIITVTDSAGTAYSGAGSVDLAAGDFFFREGAYGTAGTSAVTFANCQEINGISNLVSDGSSNSETTTNFTTTWGLTRTSYWYLQSLMKDYSSAELTETNLLEFMMDLQYSRQAQPNLLMTTPKAELKYFGNQVDGNRRFSNVGPISHTGGMQRMGIQLGSWQLAITSLGSVPSGTVFMLNTDDFAFCQNSPLEWVLGDGGNVLVQSHTGDNKFASAVQYLNFVCFDCYRQGKGFSVAES